MVTSMDKGAVLLFGPQALSFDEKSFIQLRETVLNDVDSQWIVDTISKLPAYWEAFSSKIRKLEATPGLQLLQDLNDWLKTGNITPAVRTLPNILLSPLVVITQLTQYTTYLQLTQPNSTRREYCNNNQASVETIGLCTGLLSAMAVSSSTNKVQFQENAATAVRLAMLIGGIVDAEEILGRHKASKSLATVWNSPSTKAEMTRILKEFPEAYVSVLYDENRATVTTSACSLSSLQSKLRAAGIIATEVNLCGRFHCDCYSNDIQQLLHFCDDEPTLRFPEVSDSVLPIRSNGGDIILEGKLHHFALKSILLEQSRWYQTFSAVYASRLRDESLNLVCFGPERCVPPSFLRTLSAQPVYMSNLDEAKFRLSADLVKPLPSPQDPRRCLDNDIAVVGYSLKVAGADDSEEFWRILCQGKSQHIEITPEKISFETHWRKLDPKRRWYGNFIRDQDAFDHKFFKKSPREVSSQDPQQRLMMQVAYQAVEQSGYLNRNADVRVGCYIGVCATDYENNIACHDPTAFSATGNLRSFIAGKISHYFGWLGPSMTVDSACSASAVCIHMACRAILGGECTAALAGGVNVMTNPLWFQNLAGASFLSPTGACKPFDAKADGYCRGEGIAAVFLKKMSQAVADGDIILGCISGTAVYQNENCTPIFVPNSPSLSKLFGDVTYNAGLDPQQITVVEAHGTGTPVGDPAEYESIRRVFGGSIRQKPIPIGSVKGLIGHTEGASGVLALIKILLMIQEGKIPPQASFQTLSPHIKSSPLDMLEVVTHLKDWDVEYRAALINNYGASGSNASLVVTQPLQHKGAGSLVLHSEGLSHPFWVTGLDERSIRDYATRLRQLIRLKSVSAQNISVANLSFNLSRQSNRNLDKGLIFTASSIPELDTTLTTFIEKKDNSHLVTAKKSPRPIILCFGGQISTFIGLDRSVYDSVQVLRDHLGHCDSILRDFGLNGLYPEIFEKTPIQDTEKLQTMLFSLQYSVARTWIDCGVKVAAIVGHSFGELTGLCVSGVLSLRDALMTVAARARLVRDSWGDDPGSMMAVEGDLGTVQKLLSESNRAVPEEQATGIACFNGPRSFTIAGSRKAIDAVYTLGKGEAFSSVRMKILNVTNAFHSTLVDPLLNKLEELGKGITYNRPSIHMERATEVASTESSFSATFFADHMRNPVYFNHAVQRLSEKFPSAIFLEAGSNSTITGMASRALGAPKDSYFQAVNITSGKGLENVIDVSVSLWKEGVKVTFWPHHQSQTYEYAPVLLPPYQFEKARHWLDAKKPQKATIEPAPVPAQQSVHEELPKGLLTFVGYQDTKQQSARFRINTMIKKYEDFVSGHLIAQTAPICPATLEVDMVIEALNSLQPTLLESNYQPEIHNVENQSPICIDPSRYVWLDLKVEDSNSHTWEFKIVSSGSKGSVTTLHVSGYIKYRSIKDPELHAEFSRYNRLVGHHRCLDLLETKNADDMIQGRNIYKTFAEIVDYGDQYRGLRKLVGKGNESAGQVIKKKSDETWLDTHLSDCFSQVGGIWVNCMTDRLHTDMYIANGFEQWIRSPMIGQKYSQIEAWDVFAYHQKLSEKAYVTDIFVFDSVTGVLAEAILGINYAKVAKLSMSKMLTRLTANGTQAAVSASPPSNAVAINTLSSTPANTIPESKPAQLVKALKPLKQNKATSAGPNISGGVKAALAELSGLEVSDIKDNTDLADIGIDSLMGMEMAKELEEKFHCSLPEDQLVEVTNVKSLIQCVQSAVGSSGANSASEESCEDLGEKDSDSLSLSSETNTELSSLATNLPEVSTQHVNIPEYLADFLGVEEGDIAAEMILRDLGVDSLLSTELLSDLEGKFDVHLPEDTILEELTVIELDAKINGKPATVNESPDNGKGREPEYLQAANPNITFTAVTASSSNRELQLTPSAVLDAFNEIKKNTDQYIADFECADYLETVNPKQVQMCIALIVEAFEKLGCSLRTAKPGEKLERIKYLPQHDRLAQYLYMVLERDARLIDVDRDIITRTAISPPSKSSQELLGTLMQKYPNHEYANRLTNFAGTHLADVLTGESDGIKLIFGADGRDLVSGLYGDSMLNKLSYKMMEDFLKQLISKLKITKEAPLKILEMGAGTGGTTKLLVPMLASLNIPVEYTYTDLSPSFTAAARKKFKQYPFMKFRVHDIEKPPADDLLGTQHIIIASNAVHATHSLTESGANIRKALRDDGFLLMLEMTQTLVWIDIIFGLLEGWWLFEDGRQHAIAHQSRWERDLQSVGFGHVDWTDGNRPEVEIQRIIIAMATGPRYDRLSISHPLAKSQLADTRTRQATVDEYVRKYTNGFTGSAQSSTISESRPTDQSILVTGATGSLGSHLVEHFAGLQHVKAVICINRPSKSQDPYERQREAFQSRGINISTSALSKLKVIETEASKEYLGLSQKTYNTLIDSVTHIVHNSWPMSGKRPVKGFEQQFQVMRNLIDFARDISARHVTHEGFKVGFQFISSIATVGHYPLRTGNANVPEEHMTIESVLPNGYGDAKFICEKMLGETLNQHKNHFRSMAVRLGQVAGSKSSGYWNPQEHLSFIIKSSQTLRALPDFDGLLSWTPVNDVAAALGDILLGEHTPYPIYHIDNPVRQPWRDMIPKLAKALNIPLANIIPFDEWVKLVRRFAGSESDNPAVKLIEFLDGNFLRMSCGGLLLDTTKSREHSPSLRQVGPVSEEVTWKYVQAWKVMGFLR